VHTHLELTALRGFLEALAFDEWLGVLTAVRAELLDAAALRLSARAGIREGLLAGVTTFGDATATGASLEAMNASGVRGITYLETFGPAPEQQDRSMRLLRDGVDRLRGDATGRVQVGVSPHAPYTVSPALFSRVARFCIDERLPTAVHVAESAAEVEFVRGGSGPFAARLQARGIPTAPTAASPVALLHDTGMLEARPLLVHAVHLGGDDLQLIARSGSGVAHCPVSNAKLGHGIAPLEQIIGAGIPTGLGSDSVASNNRMDLLQEARQATLMHAVRSGSADSLSARDALYLATLGGARALGIDALVGSIEPGKAADLVAFPFDVALGPVHDPAVTLVHTMAGAVSPALLLIDGEERVRDGRVRDDDPAVAAGMEELGVRLRQWREPIAPVMV
jgi:cytosine/adenosine deaminase-related metal-dependent hydrolase